MELLLVLIYTAGNNRPTVLFNYGKELLAIDGINGEEGEATAGSATFQASAGSAQGANYQEAELADLDLAEPSDPKRSRPEIGNCSSSVVDPSGNINNASLLKIFCHFVPNLY